MRRPLNLWLMVVIVVCGASIWFGRGVDLPSLKRSPKTQAVAPVNDFTKPDSHPSIFLLILNGTEEKGLARDFSLIVSRIGCVPQGTGNAPAKPWGKSILVNRRLSTERAKQLAVQLGDLPVIREFDGRATEDAILVLGADHAQIREKLHPRRLMDARNR